MEAKLTHNVCTNVVYKLRSAFWIRPRARAPYLANRDCAEAPQLFDDFTLEILLLSGALLAFKSADPTDKAHGRLEALDVKLVLEGDRKAVQGPDELAVCLEVVVQLLCARQGSIKTNLKQKVALAWVLVNDSTVEGAREGLRTS